MSQNIEDVRGSRSIRRACLMLAASAGRCASVSTDNDKGGQGEGNCRAVLVSGVMHLCAALPCRASTSVLEAGM